MNDLLLCISSAALPSCPPRILLAVIGPDRGAKNTIVARELSPTMLCNDRADVLSLHENTMSAYAFVRLGRQIGGNTEITLEYHSLGVNTDNR